MAAALFFADPSIQLQASKRERRIITAIHSLDLAPSLLGNTGALGVGMAAAERDQSEEQTACSSQAAEQAVDESSDVDGDFATLQKMLSQKRRAAKDSPGSRLAKALPLIATFSPNIRPLTISDLESCITLENLAFPNPDHRATPEKASSWPIQRAPEAQ